LVEAAGVEPVRLFNNFIDLGQKIPGHEVATV